MRTRLFLPMALLCVALAPAGVWAQGRVPTMTRLVRLFLDQEEALLRAQKSGAKAEFDRLLAEDFELRVARQPATPVPREEWLVAMSKTAAQGWTLEQMAVHDHGNVAVASFLMRPVPQKSPFGPVFVVDTWVQSGEQWRLATRYAAPAGGPGQVPGELPGAQAKDTIDKRY
jgi:hypothetical protein